MSAEILLKFYNNCSNLCPAFHRRKSASSSGTRNSEENGARNVTSSNAAYEHDEIDPVDTDSQRTKPSSNEDGIPEYSVVDDDKAGTKPEYAEVSKKTDKDIPECINDDNHVSSNTPVYDVLNKEEDENDIANVVVENTPVYDVLNKEDDEDDIANVAVKNSATTDGDTPKYEAVNYDNEAADGGEKTEGWMENSLYATKDEENHGNAQNEGVKTI